MVFAAGLGTRMGPLTEKTPKALLLVRGKPLLAHVLERLAAVGAHRVIVNVSQHEDLLREWLGIHAPAGVHVVVSPEPDGPYETGGALARAAPLFRATGPILLHNVDVLSHIPLDALLEEHGDSPRLATLAVQRRESSRRLLFDDAGLMGWKSGAVERLVREPRGAMRSVGFSGIQVIEPALLPLIGRGGAFSIRELYLDLAEGGHVIQPYDATAYPWLDVGTPERLAQANQGAW